MGKLIEYAPNTEIFNNPDEGRWSDYVSGRFWLIGHVSDVSRFRRRRAPTRACGVVVVSGADLQQGGEDAAEKAPAIRAHTPEP